MFIKRVLLRLFGVQVGHNAKISSSIRFLGNGKIQIGDNAWLSNDIEITCEGTLVIEHDVSIGSHCVIVANGSIHIHNNVAIANGNIISGKGNIEIGQFTEIYQSNLLMANGNSCIVIGENCKIAHFVSLKTSHHEITPEGECIGGKDLYSDITVEKGVWICAGAIVIPNTTVGHHSIVGAGAVVIRNVRPRTLVVGVPAIEKKMY